LTLSQYLLPGKFIESDDPAVIEFANHTIGNETDETGRVLRLFYRVRDDILYDPYLPFNEPSSYSAKVALETGRGWCVPKSALLTACARVIGVPARPGYADVVNHMTTPKMRKSMGTDVFAWHSYTELYLKGKWVKATPVFNKSMCDKFGLKPLDFDGETDSLFHEFDKTGNKHMEYIKDRGTYQDVPFDKIIKSFARTYKNMDQGIKGDFQKEADQA
jgi:transglutaminase-like putative cysteine protease